MFPSRTSPSQIRNDLLCSAINWLQLNKFHLLVGSLWQYHCQMNKSRHLNVQVNKFKLKTTKKKGQKKKRTINQDYKPLNKEPNISSSHRAVRSKSCPDCLACLLSHNADKYHSVYICGTIPKYVTAAGGFYLFHHCGQWVEQKEVKKTSTKKTEKKNRHCLLYRPSPSVRPLSRPFLPAFTVRLVDSGKEVPPSYGSKLCCEWAGRIRPPQ